MAFCAGLPWPGSDVSWILPRLASMTEPSGIAELALRTTNAPLPGRLTRIVPLTGRTTTRSWNSAAGGAVKTGVGVGVRTGVGVAAATVTSLGAELVLLPAASATRILKR